MMKEEWKITRAQALEMANNTDTAYDQEELKVVYTAIKERATNSRISSLDRFNLCVGPIKSSTIEHLKLNGFTVERDSNVDFRVKW